MSEAGRAHPEIGVALPLWNFVVYKKLLTSDGRRDKSLVGQGIIEGDNPVRCPALVSVRHAFLNESQSCLGPQLKMGGKFHLKLNMGETDS